MTGKYINKSKLETKQNKERIKTMSNDIMSLMQEVEDKSAPVSVKREEQIFQALESDGILYLLYGRYPPTARAMARRGVLKLNGDLKPC